MRLTPAGTVLHDGTVAALAGLHRAAGEARRLAGGDARLRLTLGPRFATNWLFPRLATLHAALPHMQFEFDVSDEVRDFAGDDVDAAIRFGPGRYPGTESVRLFGTALIAAAHPRLAGIARPADLLGQTLCHVRCKIAGRPWPGWREWMAAAGVDEFDDAACVAFKESSHVVQAATDGGAIGLVELPMVARELAEGRLVRLFDVEVPVADDWAYHFVHPAGSAADPRIAALGAWLLEQSERGAVQTLNVA
jgi:LysR family glycine cleavage system transcriptional activator